MGCDIHARAETRKKGKWEPVGAVFSDTYNKNVKSEEPYSGRNYELFAFLADVRNRFGIVPIAENKGWPEDLSDELKKELVEYWESDGHSASWFTLKELCEADWKQIYTKSGVVPADVYEYLRSLGKTPEVYSQGVFGLGIKILEEKEFEELPWSEKTNGTRWHVRMYWQESVADACSFFLEETMPQLATLGEPEDVRIVFNFDN